MSKAHYKPGLHFSFLFFIGIGHAGQGIPLTRSFKFGILGARILAENPLWYLNIKVIQVFLMDFPSSSAGKESTCIVGDLGSIPGLGRSPRGGHDNPLQYSCLENPDGQWSLAGYSPWGHKESDMTEQLSTDILKHYVDYIKHTGGANTADDRWPVFTQERIKMFYFIFLLITSQRQQFPQQQEDHTLSKWTLDIYQNEKYSESSNKSQKT